MSTLHRVLARDPETARNGGASLTLTVIAVAAVALAVVVIPLLVARPRPTHPSPRPGVTTVPGPLQIVPDPGAANRHAVTTSVQTFLQTFYEMAFIKRKGAGPSPSPARASILSSFFTVPAVRALSAQPGAFDPGDGVDVTNGRLDFGGLISMTGVHPVQAFLNVGFTGAGTARGSPVTVTQRGTVLLVHSEQGWLVSGFDVRLEAVSVTPSPDVHGART